MLFRSSPAFIKCFFNTFAPILERNWTCDAGEADIIANHEGDLVFVEVKTRSNLEHGLPDEAVDAAKLPCLILDGNQYIFNCLNVDPVRKNDDERVHCSFGENTVQFVLYLDGILDEDCVINKDGVIEYHDPHCKHCFSHDVIKKSYNRRKIYLENGISVIIKVKQSHMPARRRRSAR